jgi:ATP-dependent Lon protease
MSHVEPTQLTFKQKQHKQQQKKEALKKKEERQREMNKKRDNDSETGDESDSEEWETASELQSSDDDDDDDDDDESEDESCSLGSEDTDETEETEEVAAEVSIETTRITKDDEKALKNIAKLHDVISEIFPSKFMEQKLRQDKKMQKNLEIIAHDKKNKLKYRGNGGKSNSGGKSSKLDLYDSEDDSDYTPPSLKKHSKNGSNKKGSKSKKSAAAADDDDDEAEKDAASILMLFGGGNRDDYISEFEEDSEDEKESNPEEEERIFAKDLVPPSLLDAIKHYSDCVIPTTISTSKPDVVTNTKKSSSSSSSSQPLEQEYLELLELRHEFREKLQKKPDNRVVKRALRDVESKIRKLIKRGRKENTKKYYRLIHAETRKKSEIHYFENNLSHKEQEYIVAQMQRIESQTRVDKPYRISLLQSDIPENFKAIAMHKLNALASMDPMDSEYYKLKNWVDQFMKIPFGVYRQLPVCIGDGPEKCRDFMEDAVKRLDNCVYGMKDVKMQVLQLIGQWISNPASMGQAIALQGPPGTGKTSIIKDGISKIMGRDFAFIPLGGCGDSSFLEGHSYTYEGSTYGHILQQIIQKKSMNLVFYFDELDKVSDTARGQEIIGILTHLTDSTQNNQYHDKYFSEIDFDLSKCIFLFSYNDETLVNPILRDRFKKIRTQGYSAKEKVVIARDYLVPKICEEMGMAVGDLIIPDDVVMSIIENHTGKEEGVRNLKRCLETIYAKVNMLRLMRPATGSESKSTTNSTNTTSSYLTFDREMVFPLTVTRDDVEKFVKQEGSGMSTSHAMMYV